MDISAEAATLHREAIVIDGHFEADFLVEFNPHSGLGPFDQYFDFADALRRALERPVDLVESGSIDNPYLWAAIERSRELVYAS